MNAEAFRLAWQLERGVGAVEFRDDPIMLLKWLLSEYKRLAPILRRILYNLAQILSAPIVAKQSKGVKSLVVFEMCHATRHEAQ